MTFAEQEILNTLFCEYGSTVIETLIERSVNSIASSDEPLEKEYWKTVKDTLTNAVIQIKNIELRMEKEKYDI